MIVLIVTFNCIGSLNIASHTVRGKLLRVQLQSGIGISYLLPGLIILGFIVSWPRLGTVLEFSRISLGSLLLEG